MGIRRVFLSIASILPMNFGVKLYKLCGLKIGKGTSISRAFYVDRVNGLQIGKKSFFNYGVHCHCGSDENYCITVGNNCFIGPEVCMCCATHEISSHEHRAGKNVYGSIRICDGCWIGMRSVILPNVTIAEGCVVAAGSVVTKSTEPDALYAGIPAKKIRNLN